MTGWGMGFCATAPGATPAEIPVAGRFGGRGYGCRGGWGRGGGRGMGGGRGRRNMFHATGLPGWARFGAPDAASQQDLLKQQADLLQRQLDAVKAQLVKDATES
jgi:hypothetical protein